MKTIHYTHALAAALIALASVSAHATQVPTRLVGTLTTTDQASRAINVDAKTSYVNVTHGETVKFNVNGKEFAVRFDGTPRSFPLNQLAPAGVLDHQVEVYIRPSSQDERSL